MTIEKKMNGNQTVYAVSGRLDTASAPQLEQIIRKDLNGVTDLVLDFKSLEYISSAGLRVLLSAQKIMNKQGKMTVIHVSDSVREVLEMTGFLDILHVE